MDVTFASRPAPRHINEDYVAATGQAVVVLDGLSVPDGMDTGCVHGTPWFVQQLGTRLLHRITQIPLVPLRNALADAINDVASNHRDTCDLEHSGTPAATVAMLRTAGHIEHLVLSDSVIVLDTYYEGIQVVQDSRVEGTAVSQAESVLAASVGTPEHAERRRLMVSERRTARNTEGGYWVASTSPEAAGHAVTGSHRPAHVKQAAVLSDGAARLIDFGLTDWAGALHILSDGGPDELIMQVRAAERADVDCVRWPRSKPYDDATAVFCRIDNIRSRW